MVDFIRNNIDRIMKIENSRVSKLNKSTTVDKLSDQNKDRNNFTDQLKKKKRQNKGKKSNVDSRNEKELLESNIVVDSSLNRELEKNRTISALVKEKFVNNEELNSKIDFEEESDIEDDENKTIDNILNNHSLR